jgi:hypothetical protein
MEATVNGLLNGSNVLFLMLGAVMVFAMHAGFAFLEVGTVTTKSQVNAFSKILTDWAVSTVIYFVIGYPRGLSWSGFSSCSVLRPASPPSFPAASPNAPGSIRRCLPAPYSSV